VPQRGPEKFVPWSFYIRARLHGISVRPTMDGDGLVTRKRGDAKYAEGIVVLEHVETVDVLDSRGSVLILGLTRPLRALRASA
jgi:hypothetical protein